MAKRSSGVRGPSSRGARARKLILVGGETPQLKARSVCNWSKAKEAAFLVALSETCNVTRAAEEAGVSTANVYRHRKKNASFRAAWGEALSIAYRRLELVLLERTFDGQEKVFTRKDGSEERVREYSTAAGLALLKMHREAVGDAETEFTQEDVARLRERLAQKLKRLKAREDAAGQEGDSEA